MIKKYYTERFLQKNFLLKDGDYQSTKEVVYRVAKYLPDTKLFCELDSERNLKYYTGIEVLNYVENIGDGLISLGLENKHIAIMAENSFFYVMCDLAISGGVGVVSPIDKDCSEQLLTVLLNKSKANAIICSAYLVEKVQKVISLCPTLLTIITIDKKVEGCLCLSEVIEQGKSIQYKNIYRNKELDLSAPAKILFTSGTTGINKAVVLSQNNLSANIINCLDTIKAPKKEYNLSMSILPMHHATEINTHIIPRLACGRLTYINDSMRNLMANLKIFKPTLITIVPMIANAFYNAIWSNARKMGKDKKLKKGIFICKLVKFFTGKDITHTLMKDVYENFGGNLTEIVVGGAMLNPTVVKGFKDLGIFVINGYGITECGPLVSMNTDTVKEYRSIGTPCPNLQVKISNPDETGIGELCVKGKSVFSGYYCDQETTNLVLDKDGFFHTGDMAYIDKKGKIFLSGRKKNTIVLSNGKNVYPEAIESEIENHIPYIKDIVVYLAPSTEDCLCAGIYIEDLTISGDKEKIKNDFNKVNALLPSYQNISLINLVDSPYERTSTKKIKRDTIEDRHKEKFLIKL